MTLKLHQFKILAVNKHIITFLFVSCFFHVVNLQAQLGFCAGNSGNPIFTENFGIGLTNSALPVGTTTYTYSPNGYPDNGEYTVRNNSNSNGLDWHQLPEDHTVGDTNGKFLIVQADQIPGEFYQTTISGLCETTTYEFSAWVINLVIANSFCSRNGGTIPINVRFEIWDSTGTTTRLAFADTGNISETSNPNWQEFGLVFQTLAGQNTVVLKMINNGQGGCGNDLAIDDIEFKTCGDLITVSDSSNNNNISLCSSQTPMATILTANPDGAVYSSHFYQWQESVDGVVWTDVVGATNQNLSISIATTKYYRTKVAEVAINLSNSQCIALSNVYQITVNQAPSIPTVQCWQTAIFNTATCSWDITGTQPLPPTGLQCWQTSTFNNTTCVWDINGTQPLQPAISCWETATFNTTTCSWDIAGTQPPAPTGLQCWETATFNTATCNWDVIGTQPPAPTGLQCWETATFNTTTCNWDVTGAQPLQPTIACWETATFNSTTCNWDVTGTQPPAPSGLQCWETTTFNNTTCSWNITGTQPVQPTIPCWETATFNIITCNWDVTGTQPPQPTTQCWQTATFNTTTCSWDVTGIQPSAPTGLQCWQTTTFNISSCSWDIIGTQPGQVFNDDIEYCNGQNPTLYANATIPNPTYLWSTGEVTDSITPIAPGIYTVEITSPACFFETRNFNVTQAAIPNIDSVYSEGSNIVIATSNTGDFLYSINGNVYQPTNTFFNVKGGLYTVYVKERNCPEIITKTHLHFYIPKYFTPNNDGKNDTFSLRGIEYFGESQISIFNRYGKLMKSSQNGPFEWDGTFNNTQLPTDDYWYVIIIDNQEFKGHFSLKR